jgi:hypothetical protein
VRQAKHCGDDVGHRLGLERALRLGWLWLPLPPVRDEVASLPQMALDLVWVDLV